MTIGSWDIDQTITVTPEAVLDALSDENHDDIIEFVRDLDDRVGDWDFTKKLGVLVHHLFQQLNDEEDNDESYRQGAWNPMLVSLGRHQWNGHVFERADDRPTRCMCGVIESSIEHTHKFVSGGVTGEMCLCGAHRLAIHHRYRVSSHYEEE